MPIPVSDSGYLNCRGFRISCLFLTNYLKYVYNDESFSLGGDDGAISEPAGSGFMLRLSINPLEHDLGILWPPDMLKGTT